MGRRLRAPACVRLRRSSRSSGLDAQPLEASSLGRTSACRLPTSAAWTTRGHIHEPSGPQRPSPLGNMTRRPCWLDDPGIRIVPGNPGPSPLPEHVRHPLSLRAPLGRSESRPAEIPSPRPLLPRSPRRRRLRKEPGTFHRCCEASLATRFVLNQPPFEPPGSPFGDAFSTGPGGPP